MRIFKPGIRFENTIYSNWIRALESICNYKNRYPILNAIIYITWRLSNILNPKLYIVIQYTLKKATGGNTRSVNKLSSSIEIENTSISN